MPTDPTASAERLYRAPRNAVAAPLGRNLSTPAGSRDIPVLIRLVWERRVQIVPARVLRWGYGTAYVEWWPNPESSSVRATWLPRSDVRTDLSWHATDADLRGSGRWVTGKGTQQD